MSCNDFFADCCDCCVEDCCTSASITFNCGPENCNCCQVRKVFFTGAGLVGEYPLVGYFTTEGGLDIIDYIAADPCTCPGKIVFIVKPIGEFGFYYLGEGPQAIYWFEPNGASQGCEPEETCSPPCAVGFFSSTAGLEDFTVQIEEDNIVGIELQIGCYKDSSETITWPS